MTGLKIVFFLLKYLPFFLHTMAMIIKLHIFKLQFIYAASGAVGGRCHTTKNNQLLRKTINYKQIFTSQVAPPEDQ